MTAPKLHRRPLVAGTVSIWVDRLFQVNFLLLFILGFSHSFSTHLDPKRLSLSLSLSFSLSPSLSLSLSPPLSLSLYFSPMTFKMDVPHSEI